MNDVTVPAAVLMCAFRHALGRQSYVAHLVAGELIAHRDALGPDWRRQVTQDIEVAIAEGRAGEPFDVERWRAVAAAMS